MGDSSKFSNMAVGDPIGILPQGTEDTTKRVESPIPKELNTAYANYIPDFLLVNTPYQFPDRYKKSLSGYAGTNTNSGVDPVRDIQDIFMNADKYGTYDPAKNVNVPGKKGAADDILSMMSFGLFG